MTNSTFLIYNEIKGKVKSQFSSIDSLNQKAGILLASIGIFLGLTLRLKNEVIDKTFSLYFIGLFLIFTSSFFIIRSFLPKTYRQDPNPRNLKRIYSKENEEKTIDVLSDNYISTYENNNQKLKRLSQYILISVILLFIGIVFISTSVLIS